ncbi:hypothetical protein WJX73_000235 [Symbiochloris irregularis]|uniref:Uncharacterized protein n=1 Tax=Symbiochloris irregularis TaxID=706552 RepID=A0AAW1P8R8_9CHLO
MRGLLLLTAVLLCDLAAVRLTVQALPSTSSFATSSSPAFFWSSLAGAVQDTGAGNARTSYEAVPFSALLPSALSGLAQPQAADTASHLFGKSSPDLLVIFSGPEVDAAQLAQRPQDFQVLQSLLQSSAASLSLPYATHAVADLPSSIEEALSSAQLSGKQAVADLVQESGRSHAFLFGSRPQAELSEQQRRRLLSQGPWRQLLQDQSPEACNAKCRSQVMILQGIILTVTLLSSLAVGLSMMHAVGTPSRFETPKEAARQD